MGEAEAPKRGTASPYPRGGDGRKSAGGGHGLGSQTSEWDVGVFRGWRAQTHVHKHTADTWSTAHRDRHRLQIHTLICDHMYSYTHARAKIRQTPKCSETMRSHSKRTRRHTYTLSHTQWSGPARRPHKVAESTQGSSRETPRSAAPPASNQRGRSPAAESRAPARTRTSQPLLGPAPARLPGAPRRARPALPAASCIRLPRPALPAAPRVRLPRPALPTNRPAPRSPGAASDQLPASAALNLRNNKQPDMSESTAAGPPFLPLEPPASLDWEGAVVPPRQLVPGPRATHAHTQGTHTHISCHRPLGRPRATGTHSATAQARSTLATFLDTQPARTDTHTYIRSRHAPTHAFPTHFAFTRTHTAPGGAHHQPQTLPHVHIAHTAHGHTRSGPVPTPSHTYTDLTSIHTTHAFPDPHTGRIHRALPATHITQTHNTISDTQQTAPHAMAYKMQTNATHSR